MGKTFDVKNLDLPYISMTEPSRMESSGIREPPSYAETSSESPSEFSLSRKKSENKKFEYDTIEGKMIRLFKLDIDNSSEEQLSGRLMCFHHDLNPQDLTWRDFVTDGGKDVMKILTGSESYDALSYAWGSVDIRYPLYLSTISNKPVDTAGKEKVLMDHEPDRKGILDITETLYSVLLQLRRIRYNRFIWIDALCINQADEAEKTLQIPRMKDIYEYAEIVYVWLGEASAMEKGALTIMKNVTKILHEAAASATHELDPQKPETFDAMGLPDPSHPVWQALGGIMTRPWWSRLWTLQEVVVPEKDDNKEVRVEVLCGDTRNRWNHFDEFTLAVSSTRLKDWIITGQWGLTVGDHNGFDGIAEVRTCRESVGRYGWAVSLSALLLASRRRRATVPADMVFGMLAMLDRHRIRKFALKVSLPPTTIFIAFGKHYIRNEPKEMLLNHTSALEKLEGLPSWCPNFASPEETISLGTRWLGHFEESTEHRAQMYHSGFMKKGKWKKPRSKFYYPMNVINPLRGRHQHEEVFNTSNPRQIALVPDTDFILAKGLHMDTIAAFVDCNTAAESVKFLSFNSIQQTKSWEETCFALARQYSADFDSYARTLVANRVIMEPSYNEQKVFDHNYELELVADYLNFKQYMQAVIELGEEIQTEGNLDKSALRYSRVMEQITRRRRFFVTAGRRIGLGPADTQVGDHVCVIFFCPTPYILRQSKERFVLVGESYVHGLMYGEALAMFDSGKIVETEWIIE